MFQGHTSATSPVNPPFHHYPLPTTGGEHPSVPFGAGPYACPRHCITPMEGHYFAEAFMVEEHKTSHEDLFVVLDQEDTFHKDAAATCTWVG